MLVTENLEAFKEFDKGILKQPDTRVVRTDSLKSAMAIITSDTVDLVIVDEKVSDVPGKMVIEQIMRVNPMVNTALVSPLGDDDFHEDTEGLGVLMRIPPFPEESVAETVVEKLKKVMSLYAALS
jgi:two-component SAPR family response regulator